MNKLQLTRIILTIALLLSLFSCMEDVLSSANNVNLDTSSKILQFIESNNDYINSNQIPAIVDAQEVKSNLDKYYLIDIRSDEEFKLGHIQNSYNVKPEHLIDAVENIDMDAFSKIVIISSTGQHAAYCTAILRFLNYTKIYSLNFGIASWNVFFADPWLTALANQKDPCFTNKATQLAETFPLPQLKYTEPDNLNTFIYKRARLLLSKEFYDSKSTNVLTDISVSFNKFNVIAYKTLESITNEATGQIISIVKELYSYSFLICFGDKDFYNLDEQSSHPESATLFLKEKSGRSFFQSNLYLQKISPGKIIYVYSFDGQESAAATAYLNMLGYTAKTILFGSHNFQYNDLKSSTLFADKIFSTDKIKGYSYETE